MTDRAACVVPGCRNSSAKWLGFRYICSPHFRTVPRWMKRRRTRLAARLRQMGEMEFTPDTYRPTTARARRLIVQAWMAMENAAIRRAAGL